MALFVAPHALLFAKTNGEYRLPRICIRLLLDSEFGGLKGRALPFPEHDMTVKKRRQDEKEMIFRFFPSFIPKTVMEEERDILRPRAIILQQHFAGGGDHFASSQEMCKYMFPNRSCLPL